MYVCMYVLAASKVLAKKKSEESMDVSDDDDDDDEGRKKEPRLQLNQYSRKVCMYVGMYRQTGGDDAGRHHVCVCVCMW